MKRVGIFIVLILLICAAFSQTCDDFDVEVVKRSDVRCFGEENGVVEVVVTRTGADTSPYIYEWNDGGTGAFRDDLPAAVHFVEVTDATGCTRELNLVQVDQPGLLTLSSTQENVACHGDATGTVDLTVAGGTPPYDFTWSNGESTEDLSILVANIYTVAVADANGCEATHTVVISEPEPLGVSATVIPVSCFDGSDGEIQTEIFGGVPPYRIFWDTTADTIRNILNLSSGDHIIQVTDANNCVFTQAIFVPQPNQIQISFVVEELSCFEAADGAILAQVSGGNPGYTYQWSNSDFVLGDTTANPGNLTSDFYTLLITDDNGCEYLDSVFVGQPNPMVLNLEPTPASCFGNADGAIDLTISGGVGPFQVLWSNDETTEDVDELLSGTYEVVVTDVEGCTQYGEIFVGQPDSLDFRAVISEVSCKDQDDGAIQLNPRGGTPGYSVSWSPELSSGFSIGDLEGGNYLATLVDGNNCIYQGVFTVEINPRECISLVTVPNAFTPNDDGYNDLWIIRNFEVYPNIVVQVFNSWGKRVFESVGYTEAWDGTFRGQQVEAGTYYYIIDLKNGDPSFTGILTLVR